MLEAIIGFLGVIVGALLTSGVEWLRHRSAVRKESDFLCIQVGCLLERYAEDCVAVVMDDGLYHGQPDEDGFRKPQVEKPTLSLNSLNVEWKSLPTALMYEVMNFPSEIDTAKAMVSSAAEHSSGPDYEEYFEECRFQYSIIGSKAFSLAAKLRAHAKLPKRDMREWDPVEFLKAEQREVEDMREKRARSNAHIFSPT